MELSSKRITFGVIACLFILIGGFYLVESRDNSESLMAFKNMETTARQILTCIEIYHNSNLHYPADLNELAHEIKHIDPKLAASINKANTKLEYELNGERLTMTLRRKDDLTFKYHCSEKHDCEWNPHVPFP